MLAGDESRVDLVVVGGSAGAVDSLLVLLSGLPPAFRLPLAVVVHLPRDRPSGLAEALRGRSSLPVREAQDKEPTTAGTVFVAPPGYHLLLDEGPSFSLSVDEPVHYSRPSIDVLFESASTLLGQRVAGVVLSGANEDGSAGLGAICDAGGVGLIITPDEAAAPSCPGPP